jgi:hypothetical protein
VDRRRAAGGMGCQTTTYRFSVHFSTFWVVPNRIFSVSRWHRVCHVLCKAAPRRSRQATAPRLCVAMAALVSSDEVVSSAATGLSEGVYALPIVSYQASWHTVEQKPTVFASRSSFSITGGKQSSLAQLLQLNMLLTPGRTVLRPTLKYRLQRHTGGKCMFVPLWGKYWSGYAVTGQVSVYQWLSKGRTETPSPAQQIRIRAGMDKAPSRPSPGRKASRPKEAHQYSACSMARSPIC